jgi:diguanylate cyclase (GGDEF)-like protein
MTEQTADRRQGAAGARPPAAALRRRLTIALCAAAVVSAAAAQLVRAAFPDMALLAILAGCGVMTAISLAAAGQILEGVLASSADLELRYESAMAEALTDPLTALGNHRAFQEELDRQVEQALRYESPLALVLIDLDDFKAINDTAGHAAGDRALASLGALIQHSIRRPDRAFRVGGDELALLLPHADAEGARLVARRILAAALQPTRLRDALPEGLSFSAGVSAIPALAADRSQLYTQADAALYAAKRSGRTEVAVFTREALVPNRGGELGGALARLIAERQLTGVHQPIVDLAPRTVIGYEGLVQPQPPSPFENPAELFAAAEADGRAPALDLLCIDLLLAGAVGQLGDRFLSVNLSPTTVEAPEFGVGSMLAILRRHAFAPERLVIELTEQASVSDMPLVRSKLEACRRAGIRLAADDLGAGNTGLRLLSELRFDVLKVDVNLVQRSAPGAMSSAIIGSVVDLAARTGALVIAEGIEDEAQLSRVVALGASAGQGYLLGRPGQLLPSRVPQAVQTGQSLGPSSPMADWREAIGLPTSGAVA